MNVEKCREEVKKACEVLKNGGIILYPTDTIWGIGCDATKIQQLRLANLMVSIWDTRSLYQL